MLLFPLFLVDLTVHHNNINYYTISSGIDDYTTNPAMVTSTLKMKELFAA